MSARSDAARAAAAAFQEMGWTWATGGDHIPTEDEVNATLRSLEATVLTSRNGSAGTGRLNVEWIEDGGWSGVGYTLDLGDSSDV